MLFVNVASLCVALVNLVVMLFYVLPSLEHLDPRVNPMNKVPLDKDRD